MNHVHGGFARSDMPAAACGKMPDIEAIISDLYCQVERLGEGNERIHRALNRLGAPALPMPGSDVKQAGKVQAEPPSAIERLRDLSDYIRTNANDVSTLADRIDQII